MSKHVINSFLFCACLTVIWKVSVGIDINKIAADLAAGGNRTCQYCGYCQYESYCDGSCSYGECSLCRFRYHCSSTCVGCVCHPQPCSSKTCGANETCYEITPGRGECRCNFGTICSTSPACNKSANDGGCKFYTCFENRRNCGSNGYMLGYGRRYCYRFGEQYNKFTPAGKRWIDCTRKCLTKSLLPRYQDNTPAGQGCDSIEDSAFHTHVDCYYNCGFCDIWTTNKLALNSVYKYKDLFMFKSIKQAASVMSHKECGRGAAVELMKLTGIVGGAFAVGRVVVG